MRSFEHITNISLPELEADTTEKGRYYTTPDGKIYPSVTTVLGYGSDNSWKEKWIARVGKEEADRISRQATSRGAAVHELIEQYLKNDPSYTKGHMPTNIMSFKNIKPFLDSNLGRIAGLELPLYSDTLRTAGRVDCVAEWKDIWSIVDFKTSKREKRKEDISSYFLQCSAYAMMMYERTGLLCKQIVIVMTVDDGNSLVFTEKSRDWLPKFVELRQKADI
jgi:hypothetical protein